jgi:hypothetical protein
LGKFKVEKVFKEVAIKSPRKWMAILECGNVYRHGISEAISYDVFKNEVLG